MLPGKKYSPEDILRILFRRGWIIAIPLVISAALAVLYAYRLPNRYRSETLIMLVPQRIPDSYVKTTVTTRVEDRLATLSDQILSRSRLERTIHDFNLYQDEQKVRAMEDVVQHMRQDIKINVDNKDLFRVAYTSRQPDTAQKVAERLASLFIEENLRDRENVAEDTNQFLDSQLEDAKRRLIEQEKKLEVYRRQHSGELPSQLQSNLQAIQNAEIQRRTLAQAADREQERRIQYERQLAELQITEPVAPPAPAAPAGTGPDAATNGSTEQQLEAARAGLRVLQLRNTPNHPDVRIMQRRIADLEAKLKAEQADGTVPAEKALDPAEVVRQRRIRDVTAQIEVVDRQLKEYETEDNRLKQAIRDYQGKVDALPSRESEMVELTRDYATLQSSYQTLLAKREESKIAANLERKNIGEQFRILDPARVPERPFSPDRRSIVLTGTAAGLGIGVLILGLLEYRDSTFRSDDDIQRVLSLPVLAIVPEMRTKEERRKHRRRMIAAVCAAVVLFAPAAAFAIWRLRF